MPKPQVFIETQQLFADIERLLASLNSKLDTILQLAQDRQKGSNR